MKNRVNVLAVVSVLVLLTGAATFATEISCTVCHNDTTIITGKQTGLSEAVHGTGEASVHSFVVEDTCVTCHLGKDGNHKFEPVLASCQECHEGAKNFDIGGVQTKVAGLIAEVGNLLVAKGLLDEEGEPVVGTYPAAQASALWNYIFIVFEDKSRGVHNADYTIDMLEAAKAALQ